MILTLLNLLPKVYQFLSPSGGVGRTDQFSDGIEYGRVNALSTANLFNFMNDGLEEARMQLISEGYQLANWDNTFFRK